MSRRAGSAEVGTAAMWDGAKVSVLPAGTAPAGRVHVGNSFVKLLSFVAEMVINHGTLPGFFSTI